jgi:hypothetical protein
MNNCKHLKNKKVLIQLSDGSSLRLNCYINKKEVLIESDIKLNSFWKFESNSLELNNSKSYLFNDYKKLFIKHK